MAGPVWRENFVGMGVRENLADTGRKSGGLCGDGPFYRSGGLARMAADRKRDAQFLHSRI